ncbi:MAG: hypothetical protein WC401_00700 [Bacteroidales bacterium]|nr:hypothetical protein [Bacteroidales bacterium]
MGTKVTVSVDYGEERSFFKDTRIIDETTGKVKKFNSMIDALNYMASIGWEFVQAYAFSSGSSSTPVYHYLLKKKR